MRRLGHLEFEFDLLHPPIVAVSPRPSAPLTIPSCLEHRCPHRDPPVASQRVSAMPLFWKPYQSETTQFIESLKQQDPTLAQRQREGRALLWDREQDRDAESEFQSARVPQQAYVYQTKA